VSEVLVMDCETSGMADNAQVVQFAAVAIDVPEVKQISKVANQRYKPSVPMEWGAIATHGLWPEDLENSPPSSECKMPEGFEYIAGHNIDYDWKAMGSPDVKRICTLALCRKLFPLEPQHTLGAMVAMLCGHDLAVRGFMRGLHDAGTDAMLTAILLRRLIEIIGERNPDKKVQDADHLWRISEWARVPTHMMFGKHKGTPLKDVPSDYKTWLLKQDDVCPYLRKALAG
jgi:exodeoxyribonuclease X